MPLRTADSLIEERVAQLETISQRRNELLRQMYHMMRRRNNIGSVFTLNEAEEDDLPEFLEKLDLVKNPEGGSVNNLVDSEMLAVSPIRQDSSKPHSRRASSTRSSSKAKSPLISERNTRRRDVRKTDGRSKSQALDVMPDESIEDEDNSFNMKQTSPKHVDSEESGDVLAPSSLEQRSPRSHSRSLPPRYPRDDDADDDDDELDLIGTIVLSPKHAQPLRTPSRSQSVVIHIVDSPDAAAVEGEIEGIVDEKPTIIVEEETDAGSMENPTRNKGGDVFKTDNTGHESKEATLAMEGPTINGVIGAVPDVVEDEPMAVEEQTNVTEIRNFPSDVGLIIHGDSSVVLTTEGRESPHEKDVTPIAWDMTQEDNRPEEDEKPTPNTTAQVTMPFSEYVGSSDKYGPMLLDSPIVSTIPFQKLPKSLSSEPQALPPVFLDVDRPPVIILAPSRQPDEPDFKFESVPPQTSSPDWRPASPTQIRQFQLHPKYALPPLKMLPAEFNRKSKPTKQQRKREKEKEKNERGSDKGDGRKDKDIVKDDWVPMGLNKWGATVKANPVFKKVSRASKCLSTRDWSTALTELRLIKTLDRVESLKDDGRWSFRQPKKQRGVGGLMKTHWDYLMDEMRWMRIDFREERKWKLALAYNLSTAVLEWHAAGNLANRVAKGICVLWKRSRVGEEQVEQADSGVVEERMGIDRTPSEPPKNSLLMVDYGSDDEEDDEQEKDQSVVDALETAALIEDMLDVSNRGDEERVMEIIEPKTEDVDDSSALQHNGTSMDVDYEQGSGLGDLMGDEVKYKAEDEYKAEDTTTDGVSFGLKLTSSDPLLNSKSNSQSSNGDSEPFIKPSSKSAFYAPLREKVAYSDEQKLFLDLNDLASVTGAAIDDLNVETMLPLPDLSSIFPDLQLFGLLDVAPMTISNVSSEGKKRSEKKIDKDDPNKRTEDTTYTKLTPIGRFMYCKPTLLGPLQPSKRWKNGSWVNLEESVVTPDSDPNRITEENLCELFEGYKPIILPPMNIATTQTQSKETRKRTSDHLWTAADDSLLKTMADRYPNNWALISECFNGSRITISTDKRTPWDCHERWSAKWAISRSGPQGMYSDSPAIQDGTPPPVPPVSGQMTTRGVKRLASASVSGPHAGSASSSGSEPKKRRRHLLMQETIRKAAKKRESNQKTNMMQRKPAVVHDTHEPYNKLAALTPAELSRLKAEKETRDSQELAVARRRHEDITRQQLLRDQAHRMQTAQQAQLQQQQQQQANGAPRPPGSNLPQVQGVPQIRGQVNISQQQRIPTPMANSRLSPQHLQVRALQVAAQQAQASQAQVQAQAQAQVQGNQHLPLSLNGVGSSLSNHHLSPPSAQTSPPRTSVTPSNAVNSSRPPSAQAQAGMMQITQVPAIAIQRPPPNIGHHYQIPNLQGGYTQEQLNQAMRLHVYQAAQQQAQQLQQGAQQGSQNGSYPPQS